MSRTSQTDLVFAPDLALRAVAETTAALRDTVKEETSALRRSDFEVFARLQEVKLERAQRWHGALSVLHANRENFAGTPAQVRAGLEALRADLAKALEENLETVERANRSVKRLHARIMTITRREVEEKTSVGYSRAGTLGGNAKKAVSMGIAETA